MKLQVLIRIIFFLVITSMITFCKQEEPDLVIQRQDTITVAQIRAFNTFPIPNSILIKDAGKEGTFYLDNADKGTPDNTGTVLVTANGKRYKRSFTGPANASWWGVMPLANDIGPALQLAVDAESELVIPDGTYTQSTTVKIRSGLTLKGNPGKVIITMPKTYVSLLQIATPEDAKVPLENVMIDGLSWNITSREDGTFGTIYVDGPTVNNFTVQNCSSTDEAAKDSTNWLTVKIQAGKTGDNIVVRNNSVQAKRMGCEIFNHDNHGIYSGKNITVSGNDFHNCYFGISLSGPLENLKVDNNRVTDCSFFGIEIAGAARQVSITNNVFKGKFNQIFTGSNDGNGNGSVTGSMIVSGNSTDGLCTGGMQIFNGGAISFTKNKLVMTGILELAHSTNGGTFTDNVIESSSNKTIICDETANHTFTGNTISNKSSPGNQATFMSYGTKAINNVLTNNTIIKGTGGKHYDGIQGGVTTASANYDESGKLIP